MIFFKTGHVISGGGGAWTYLVLVNDLSDHYNIIHLDGSVVMKYLNTHVISMMQLYMC